MVGRPPSEWLRAGGRLELVTATLLPPLFVQMKHPGDQGTKLASSYYRWSHVLKPDNNWSVLTGFAMYSDAPASRHFSRSPFMAFAVSAMMGRRRKSGFWRITC